MNAAEWTVKHNRIFTFAIAAIVALGLGNFFTMPRLEDPEFTIRTALVITCFPGADAFETEKLVTDQLEKTIQELAEVKNLISESRNEISIIRVEIYERFKDIQPIWEKLRNKVNDARPQLPEGVEGPQVDDEFGEVFGIVIALRGEDYSYRELEKRAKEVRKELLRVKNTARVKIWGEQKERIYIEFSNARLAGLDIGPNFIMQSIEARNVLVPAGSALVGSERVFIEPTGKFKTVEDIRNMSLVIPGKAESIRLRDIAEVVEGYVDPPDVMTRYNGEKSLMLAVSMADNGKITEFGRRVTGRLEKIRSGLPVGLDFSYAAYQPKFVEDAVSNFMINLYSAFGFVFLVMLIFTGFRTALAAGILVPMAMLMSIFLMYPLGIGLQRVSIASLIISLGILVDNGVVVSESILVHLQKGKNRLAAVSQTVRQLAFPLLAASLTTIFAFLPIAIADSLVGEYTFSLFVVISLTLLSSWILSMTLVPFVCYYFLKVKKSSGSFSSVPYRTYRTLLLKVLRFKILSVVLAAFLSAAAWFGFRQVPEIFFPPNEREMFVIDFWLPYGTDIRTTSDRAAVLEQFILERQGAVSVGTFIGSGGPRWYLPLDIEHNTSNYAFLVINTDSVKSAERLLGETDTFIKERMPDTRADVKRLRHGPPVGVPIQIRVSGPDINTLYRLKNRIASELQSMDHVEDVWDDWGEWTKRVKVRVNQNKAERIGITSRDIAGSLDSFFTGIPISEFRKDDKLIPVVVRSAESENNSLARIDDLKVYSFASAESVPLMQVAHAELEWQPGSIRRRNANRTMTVKATVTAEYPSRVLARLNPVLEAMQREKNWPPGYFVEYGGEVEERQRAKSSIYEGLGWALLLVLLTIMAKFNSWRKFLVVVLTIPPAIIGVTAGLLLTGDPFGFMALLGMISLAGIIINNAIILVDSIENERQKGQKPQDAIVIAGQQRLRPIVMTAATTIMGLVPLSVRGGDMWSPLANIIIFGLAFSTILTLGICPALYALLFRVDFSSKP